MTINKINNTLQQKYQNWETTTSQLLQETQLQEEDEKQKSNETLGLTSSAIYSQAQADDKLKLEKQIEIKKKLDEKRNSELDAIATLENLLDGEREVVVVEDMIGEKRVISLQNNIGPGVISLPDSLSQVSSTITTNESTTTIQGLIKVFVENCNNCTIRINCKLITSTVEITNCNDIIIEFLNEKISTIQVDLCKDVTLKFNEGVFGNNSFTNQNYGDRIYHAGVSNMDVQIYKCNTGAILMETNVDYIRDGAVAKQNATAEEYQFITFVDKHQLKTERLIRYKNMALSESEFKSRNDEAVVDDLAQDDIVKQCTNHKLEGNTSFQEGNYAQAVLYYSLAIDKSINTAYKERHLCYANRSACFLKLGEHVKALDDANACIEIDETYIKGKFRKGLALHALGRYEEALPLLVECLKFEPKNKQIIQAVKFCEYRLDMERRKRND